MVRWYFARSDEARRVRDERDTYASHYHRVQQDVEALLADSIRSSEVVARLCVDRDRFLAEHDELRAVRTVTGAPHSAPQEVSPLPRLSAQRDPYAHLGSVTPSSRGPSVSSVERNTSFRCVSSGVLAGARRRG